MFTNDDMNALIKVVKQISASETRRIMQENNVETIMYGTVVAIADSEYTVQVAGGDKPYTGLKNKTGETLNTGDSVVVKAINGNAGNGYIAIKMGISDQSIAPDTIAWSKVYDTPKSLGGYGITDAKIENGTITLGLNSITPITSSDFPVQSVNGKTGKVVLIASDVGALPNTTIIPTKTSQLTNDSGYVEDANYVHTDNNFTNTLKAQISTNATNLDEHIDNTSNPHKVTKEQVGLSNVENVKQYSASNPPPYPVTSVNGYTGAVTLSASDVGALPNQAATATTLGGIKVGAGLEMTSAGLLNVVSGGIADSVDWSNVQNKPNIPEIIQGTVTLTTTWDGDSAPYSQIVTMSGLLATDEPILDIITTLTGYEDEQNEWAKIFKAETAVDAITFYTQDKTMTELFVRVKVVRPN